MRDRNRESLTAAEILAAARDSLAVYAALRLPSFELAQHISVMVDKLEAVERGEIRRLIICEPPRHGKTLLGSQLFPAWYIGRHPDRYIISSSYGQDLSDDYGRKVRNLVDDPLHRAIFPACAISADSSSMRRFNTTANGAYYAVGRGGPITGRGAHVLVIDDPLKDREEANSETIRRGLHEWYSSVAYTRLQPNGAVVLIETRWHEEDLAGWLLREHSDENWELVSFPAIAEHDESWRSEGEALWPERFSLAALDEIRHAIGSSAWASLYQQRPSAAEGAIFKRCWWQHFTEPPKTGRTIQSWDCAFKAGRENDYSVCSTWAACETGYYLVSLWRDRVEFPALKRQVVRQADAWKPNAVLVEDSASGQSLIQELKTTNLPILPVKADSDKASRAQAVTPLIESGRVFLPQSAGWLPDFLDELAAFPNAAHDDSVDSLTQALNWMRLHANFGPSAMYVVQRHEGSGSTQLHRNILAFPDAPEDRSQWSSSGILKKVL